MSSGAQNVAAPDVVSGRAGDDLKGGKQGIQDSNLD